ncbi:MAG: ABC transporter ATP-binding protein [Proteobacteria bacterium]|nr:MAG: ABC transporter ATP-binding protein [Pseudomonadota bacterium]
MSVLTLNNVGLAYQEKQVLNHVSLSLAEGDIACLLGPSGCGKTTLLRAIAGFKSLQSGEIKSGGQVLSAADFTVPTEHRQIGMVFQDLALFPHLTIGQNICFGLRHQSNTEKLKRRDELLALIGLEGYESRYPHELSGGQQQRIALARAMAPKPRLLLLDEPFSSMDVQLRGTLAKEMRNILKHESITSVMVTHDQNEAFSIADKIGVLNDGILRQWTDAHTLYHHPSDPFVAHFVGRSNFLKGTIAEQCVETALGTIFCESAKSFRAGTKVDVLIRPEYIQLSEASSIKAKLVSRQFRGGYYLYTVQLDSGEQVQILLSSLAKHQLGESVGIVLSTDHLSLFPAADQAAA